ncbi:MAG TPA: type 2 isopentenyl-diphosphate Delta-isomerase [Anaerolineaceae bacterium]|nr:type 2 isopentenyl-diphosphate Delta-isomerase [Anaerolineaceae bacterium]
MNEKIIHTRKDDHIRINNEEDVQSAVPNEFDKFYFEHQALPELNLVDIDTSVNIFRKVQYAPLLISSMIGGTEQSHELNARLARAAQHFNIGMGVGSQRIILQHPETNQFFNLRTYAPDINLFANIGAVQLNNSVTFDDCRQLVEEIGADALILHLNPLQEALQSEGNTNFAGLLSKIESLCRQLPYPVIVKEVGWGISAETARRLQEAGVSAIDVAGAGGTSWSEVEKYRMTSEAHREVAASFRNWGITTAQSIIEVKENTNGLTLFASGGLRNGVDVAKCIALGADCCGFAGLFFRAAMQSEQKLFDTIDQIIRGLRISMFAASAGDVQELKNKRLQRR